MAKMLRKEAAEHLRNNGYPFITDHYLYSLVREGKLKSLRVGNRIILDTEVIKAYIAAEMDASIEDKIS